jgi:hypothetical protein
MIFRNIIAELKRQRGKLLALLDHLDAKDLARVRYNTRLKQKRRYYQPKANGKGRPAQKPKPSSQEDQARRSQYKIELALLDEALVQAQSGPEALFGWLGAEHRLSQQDAIRLRKIEALIGQFGRSRSVSKVWEATAIYGYLHALRDRQRILVSAFKRLPAITLGEQDGEDRERARLGVLERLCTSNHAAHRETLQSAIELIAADPILPKNPHDPEVFRRAWREVTQEVADDLIRQFAS